MSNSQIAEASVEYLVAGEGVAAGYKVTEVGVIPEDWSLSSVGVHTSWLSGGTPSREREDFWRGSIPWISGSTLKSFEIYLSDQHITDEAVSCGSKMAPVGSVLLLVRGSALHNEIRSGLVVAPVAFNQDVKALITDKFLDARYLAFFFLGMEGELLKLVSSAGNSAGVLDTELVKGFKLYLPKPEEQTAIANALSDVDALINGLEKLITKKQAIKTATMQQLLTGRTRLPQFALREDGTPKGYKPSELGEVPEDWGVLGLGEISNFANGKPYEPVMKEQGKYHLITLDSVSINGDLKSTHRAVDFFDGSLRKGDLVCVLSDIAHAKLLGLCGYIDENDKYVLNQRMGRIRFAEGYDSAFMRYMINRRQDFFRLRGQGSSQRHIYRKDIDELVLACPGLEEQTAIATILSDMDEEILSLQQRLSKTRQIKQGMMHELLTGRIRFITN